MIYIGCMKLKLNTNPDITVNDTSHKPTQSTVPARPVAMAKLAAELKQFSPGWSSPCVI